jgi:polyisoprenoid-binding protein YceI
MKKITLAAVLVLLSSVASFAQKWSADKGHSKVGFTVTHLLISEVDGNFKKFDASITSSKDDFTDAVFNLTIDASSINTDNETRDNDLKSKNYFDVAQYPQITFKSTSMKMLEGKKYKMTGDLTMHGVTKTVTMDLTLMGTGKNMRSQKPIAGFKVTGEIKRKDFGIGTTPVAIVSDEIGIRAVGEFVKE